MSELAVLPGGGGAADDDEKRAARRAFSAYRFREEAATCERVGLRRRWRAAAKR
jgi:hypothetical protein